ncbi:MAG: hypothetical protein ACJ79S_01480 [Gemmatimonadaceae bacterium]
MRTRNSVCWALALSLAAGVAAGEAAAQERQPRSTRRIPVRKDTTTTPAPTPAPDTTTPPPAPTPPPPPPPPPAPAPAPPPDTTPVAPPPDTTARVTTTENMGERRSGWYFGLAGGATFPVSDTKDGWDTGWNIRVPFGWEQPGRVYALNFDVQYDQLNGKDVNAGLPVLPTTITYKDLKIWSGMLDLVLRAPFGAERRSSVYVLGGPGIHYVRDFPRGVDNFGSPGTLTPNYDNTWRFGLNGGAGVGIGVGKHAELFVEGRYVYVWTPDNKTQFIPVTGGLKWVF